MESDKATELANQLVRIKAQIKELFEYEQTLKEEIKPFLQVNGKIQLKDGTVYYVESKGAESFSRKEVLKYIRENYSDSLANQIDHYCTRHAEPQKTVYVKLREA